MNNFLIQSDFGEIVVKLLSQHFSFIKLFHYAHFQLQLD